jgi:hypothetical protein
MQSRARSLESAIRSFAREGLPIAGIGHSIGATMLLVMAGGHAQTLAGQKVSMAPKINFDRLVLFTPAMDFFRAAISPSCTTSRPTLRTHILTEMRF